MAEEAYYGAPGSADTTKSLGDRLRELYSPDEFVTVINIDTQPVTYQFTKPSDLETFSDYPGHKDTIQHAPPKRFTLKGGETKLCPAYEADRMIEVLIKQLTTRETASKISSGILERWQSTNWNDPETQARLIKQIYLGKQDIIGNYNDTLIQPSTASVESDLDINGSQERTRVSRTKNTV